MPVPTLWGWGVLIVVFLLVAALFVAFAHPFLAVNHPLGGQALVVEGWVDSGLLEEVIGAFRTGNYRWLVTTGGPMPSNSYFAHLYPGVSTYADLAATALQEMGVSQDSIVSIPAPPVPLNRTYAGALRVGSWIERNEAVLSVDVLTQSTHARRSWLIYRQAIGDRAEVGVISKSVAFYDPDRWWTTSAGVRSLLNEAIAYVYYKLFFYP
jgi:hypothetical protein